MLAIDPRTGQPPVDSLLPGISPAERRFDVTKDLQKLIETSIEASGEATPRVISAALLNEVFKRTDNKRRAATM